MATGGPGHPVGELRRTGPLSWTWIHYPLRHGDKLHSQRFTIGASSYQLLTATLSAESPLGFSFGVQRSSQRVGLYLRAHPDSDGRWPAAQFQLSYHCSSTGETKTGAYAHQQFSEAGAAWGGLTTECSNPLVAYEISVTFTFHTALLSWTEPLLLPARQDAASSFGQFFGSDDLSDCTLVVEEGDCNRTFKAHKLALCAASPVFKAMFTTSSSMAEAASSTVMIREAPTEAVEGLLQLMYGKDVSLPLPLLLRVFKLADQYSVQAITDMITQRLWGVAFFSADSLARLLPAALRMGDAAAPVRACVLQHCVHALDSLCTQPVFLHHWEASDVTAVLERLPASSSHAYAGLLLAAAWATAGDNGPLAAAAASHGRIKRSRWDDRDDGSSGADRLQVLPCLLDVLPLQCLTLRQVAQLKHEQQHVLELPGVALAVVHSIADQQAAAADPPAPHFPHIADQQAAAAAAAADPPGPNFRFAFG